MHFILRHDLRGKRISFIEVTIIAMHEYWNSPLTGPRNGNRIALNLSDLLLSSDTTIQNQSDQHPTSVDYQRELNKLLIKSRGTAYEKTLQKFIESKFREKPSTNDQSVQRDQRSESAKLDVSGLNASNEFRRFRFEALTAESPSSFQDSRERLEHISKPLERNTWKVLFIPKRINGSIF